MALDCNGESCCHGRGCSVSQKEGHQLGVIIGDVEMMTHILSKIPEEYYNIIENIEDELDDNIYVLTMKIICDNLSPYRSYK